MALRTKTEIKGQGLGWHRGWSRWRHGGQGEQTAPRCLEDCETEEPSQHGGKVRRALQEGSELLTEASKLAVCGAHTARGVRHGRERSAARVSYA